MKCIAIGYRDYRNPDRTMENGNELEESTSCIALINYMFVPCCLIHVSRLQLMRVFMLACSSRVTIEQPINQSIVLRRSSPAQTGNYAAASR
jgi:hypothetical protein